MLNILEAMAKYTIHVLTKITYLLFLEEKNLYLIRNRGKQVIDLEGLANHKGSAFGGIGEEAQPTVEQFQNNLFTELYGLNLDEAIWIEDESSNIGKIIIPQPLFTQMREQMVYFIDISVTERAKYLVNTYGLYEKNKLEESTLKISKRLGFDRASLAIEAIKSDNLIEAAIISLKYYDKFYLKGLEKRNSLKVIKIPLNTVNANESADALLNYK